MKHLTREEALAELSEVQSTLEDKFLMAQEIRWLRQWYWATNYVQDPQVQEIRTKIGNRLS